MAMTEQLGISSKAEIWIVAEKDLDTIWGGVEDIIERFGDETLRKRYDPFHLYKMALKGEVDLWLGIDSGKIDLVLFMTMLYFPKMQLYQTTWCGGQNMRKYLPFEKVEQYALLAGACETEIIGRLGWVKVMQNYELEGFVLRRNVAKRWGH